MSGETDFLQSVAGMVDHLRQTQAPLHMPSQFWAMFNGINSGQLRDIGLGNFKRSINHNYFNWIPLGTRDHQFRNLARHWAEDPSLDALQVRLDGETGIAKALAGNLMADASIRELYRVFVGLLWHYTASVCRNGLTDQLDEPALGNPLPCMLGDRLISQDLANSIRERTAALEPVEVELSAGGQLSVVEVGAGYGRLGYVLIASTPCQYTVVDIPPALGVAQWYLTTLFPAMSAFRFRPWHSFTEIADEFHQADIRFLTPDQFARCPAGCFDVGITISTLPEMTRAQFDFYLAELSRTVSGIVYIKQWVEYHNVKDDVTMRQADYVLPPPWRLSLDRVDAIHSAFFERRWERTG